MKIAINRCFGGFRLTKAAFQKYAELAGIPLEFEGDENWFVAYVPGACVEDRRTLRLENCRTDPILIKVIEELGDKASSELSEIKVIEIPDDVRFTVENYDGMETVHEVHRIWS